MSKFSQQFNSEAEKRVRLSADERTLLRDRVCAYMEYHPYAIPSDNQAAGRFGFITKNALVRRVVSLVSKVTLPFSLKHRSVVGALAVLLVAMVPALAEQSVPGDMLYAVKVNLNEEVRGSILRTPYQQVEWETERISRRLDEAQALVESGELTEESEGKVAQSIREHNASARESIDKLREEDPDEAAMAEITLSTLFDVHSTVLAERAKKQEAEEVVATAAMVESEPEENAGTLVQAIHESRGSSSASEVATPSYDGLLRKLENESAKARSILQKLSGEIEDTQLESIERRLADVDRQIEKGVALHNEGSLAEARVRLTEALVKTRKVLTFMSDLQVRSSVDLATLVPIEYTEEELAQQLENERDKLQVRYDFILTKLADKSELDIESEELQALNTVPEIFTAASAAAEAKDFASAGEHLTEIEQILTQVTFRYDIEDRLHDVPYVVPVQSTTTESSATTSTTTEDIQPLNEGE